MEDLRSDRVLEGHQDGEWLSVVWVPCVRDQQTWGVSVVLLLFVHVRLWFNCEDKSNWKDLVSGNVNHDFQTFVSLFLHRENYSNLSDTRRFVHFLKTNSIPSGRWWKGRGVPDSESRRSWGTITTSSLCDFTQYPSQEDTNFENGTQKVIDYEQTSD